MRCRFWGGYAQGMSTGEKRWGFGVGRGARLGKGAELRGSAWRGISVEKLLSSVGGLASDCYPLQTRLYAAYGSVMGSFQGSVTTAQTSSLPETGFADSRLTYLRLSTC